MTPERFENLLEAYGAEPQRWPEAERAQALSLLEAEPRHGAALARARRLDSLLDRVEAPRAGPALVARLASAPRRVRFAFAAQVAALAAAAICGLYVGWSTPAPSEQVGDEQWSSVLLGDWDEG